MNIDDVVAIAVLAAVIVGAIIAGLVACLFSHWLCIVFARAGATEVPAQFIAYAITLGLITFIGSALFERAYEGKWWWK